MNVEQDILIGAVVVVCVLIVLGVVIASFSKPKPPPPPPPKPITAEEAGHWVGQKTTEFAKGILKGAYRGVIPEKKEEPKIEEKAE